MSAGVIHRPVFLAGMMGSGKSTVGRRLAEAMGAPFVDLDRRIEHLFGRPLSTLFEAGEPAFRRLERDALVSLLAEPGFADRAVVVALGGGTLIDARNRTALREAGVTVHLAVAAETLAARLGAGERAARPLLAQSAPEQLARSLAELLAARRASYDACDVSVDADADLDDVVERVRTSLRDFERHG